MINTVKTTHIAHLNTMVKYNYMVFRYLYEKQYSDFFFWIDEMYIQ